MKRRSICRCLVAAVLAASTIVSALPVSAADGTAVPGMVTADWGKLTASASQVTFSAASGAEESVYAEWSAVTGAAGYNVYVKSGGGSYTQVDTMLVRQYASCFRVDVPGLAAGSYTLKVVPVINGKEDDTKAAETNALNAAAYDRTGFAFDGTNGAAGAYNADGTLKENAVVLYLTESTKDTVSLDVVTSSKGTTTATTGLQNILTAFKKGYDTRPLCIRVVGTVTDPSTLDKGDLTIDGGNKYAAGLTVEGIGTDATISGFGLRLKNISNVEIRNVGVMLVDSDEGDNITLQQSTDHVWVHNCDFFYGMPGSDADQKKGDGALDCKKSTYVTFSYNHFWDSGKCNLLGLSENTTEDLFITYHHNWYDHSDSRHPRIRFYSAHVYNNYYDGNSKYGIGSTNASSVFAESNYFRNCNYPMLTSMQGTDVDSAGGTFSGEDGGVIKAYGNIMEGQKAFVSYSENSTSYDAYVVSNRNDTVPSSVLPLQTSKLTSLDHSYNNFDTDSSIMYQYTADSASDVPAIVMAKAGRLNGGDFQWEFDNAVDDKSYDVNEALMAALQAYKSPVVAIGSGFTDDTTEPITTTTVSETPGTTVTTVTTTVSAEQTTSAITTATSKTTITPIEPDVPQDGDIFCSPTGKGSGTSESDPASVVDAVSKLTPGHTIWLLEGTYAFSEMILISEDNSGTADAMKTIQAYNGADVTFDFSGQGDADASKRGIVLDGDYWHFYGFEITKAADNGMLLSGNNNKIEMMVFNDNQDTGLQLSRYNTSAATVAEWPSNNLILNCTSKNNCDNKTMENADGFAAKLTCGEGNVFDGCLAYNNSDDGWDLFAKSETGSIGVVTIQNCVAFRNGYTEFGEGYGDCDGNGFKLGGSGVGSAHVVKNCLAFENLNCGFTDNNNPNLESLTNCTAYNNGVGSNGKPNVSCYRCTDDGCDFSSIISYYSESSVTSNLGASGLKIANDKFVGTIQNAIYYNSGYYQVTDQVAVGNGDKVGTKGAAISNDDFISLTAPEVGTDFHTAWRNYDGSITTNGFMQVKKDSAVYDVRGAVFSELEAPPVVTTESVTTEKSVETKTSETTASMATVSSESDVETTVSPEETTTVSGTESSSVTKNTEKTNETQTTTIITSSEIPGTTESSVTVDPSILLYGDVNLDGKVDLSDVVLMNKAVSGSVKLNAEQRANAECRLDGLLSADDSMALLRFLVHLEEVLPIAD